MTVPYYCFLHSFCSCYTGLLIPASKSLHLTVPSAWNACLPPICTAPSLFSCMSLLKCHLSWPPYLKWYPPTQSLSPLLYFLCHLLTYYKFYLTCLLSILFSLKWNSRGQTFWSIKNYFLILCCIHIASRNCLAHSRHPKLLPTVS